MRVFTHRSPFGPVIFAFLLALQVFISVIRNIKTQMNIQDLLSERQYQTYSHFYQTYARNIFVFWKAFSKRKQNSFDFCILSKYVVFCNKFLQFYCITSQNKFDLFQKKTFFLFWYDSVPKSCYFVVSNLGYIKFINPTYFLFPP